MEIDIAEAESQAIDSSHIISLENHKCSNSTASLQQICGHDTAYSGIFKGVSDGIQGMCIKNSFYFSALQYYHIVHVIHVCLFP
mgnify:CR=1 FL=1